MKDLARPAIHEAAALRPRRLSCREARRDRLHQRVARGLMVRQRRAAETCKNLEQADPAGRADEQLQDAVARRRQDHANVLKDRREMAHTHAHAAVEPGQVPQLIQNADATADVPAAGAAPLPESGPAEVRELVARFNAMTAELERLIRERGAGDVIALLGPRSEDVVAAMMGMPQGALPSHAPTQIEAEEALPATSCIRCHANVGHWTH